MGFMVVVGQTTYFLASGTLTPLAVHYGRRIERPNDSQQRQPSSIVHQPSFHGREADKEAVLQKLYTHDGNNDANHLSVLAAVGMGGLGKTTLAQLVFSDERLAALLTWPHGSTYQRISMLKS